MYYSVEYEVCALVFLILVTVRFFEVRQFPGQLNKRFGTILFCAIADLSLDIIGSFTVEYIDQLPAWVNYAVNTAFYALQIVSPTLLMSYVLVMCGLYYRSNRRLWLLLLPACLSGALLLTSPWTHWIFYLDPSPSGLVYSHGPLFNCIFFSAAFYLAVTIVTMLKRRSHINEKQFNTIICFVLVIATAAMLQFVLPQVLLIGVAISMAILMMFFTMQNPEDMLDLISGVFNYTAMISFLSNRLNEGRLWLIAVDVSGIRRLNSTLGVNTGNEALAQIGAFFSQPRLRLWPFRMISTRFLLIADNEADYRLAIGQIEERFAQVWQLSTVETYLDAKIHYFHESGLLRTPEDVVDLIDMAYRGQHDKSVGSCQQIGSEVLEQARRQLELEGALRRAVADGQGMSLHFQPLYDTQRQRFTSAEALLRLNDPQLGELSPTEFIPVAEQNGLIFRIDQLVVREAAAFLRDHEAELSQAGVEYIEVNISAAALGRNLCSLIDGVVREQGADPARLCFEVTETAAAAYQGALTDFMQGMLERGYRFAMDDFGTGYANIIQIPRLPFSIIKLDRTLLLAAEEQRNSLFQDLIRMFRRLGLTTVIEGVETEAQRELALGSGGDIIQGYYYSHPLPQEEYLSFIRSHAPAEEP